MEVYKIVGLERQEISNILNKYPSTYWRINGDVSGYKITVEIKNENDRENLSEALNELTILAESK